MLMFPQTVTRDALVVFLVVSNFDYILLSINKTSGVCQFNSFSLNEVLRRTEHQGNEIGI